MRALIGFILTTLCFLFDIKIKNQINLLSSVFLIHSLISISDLFNIGFINDITREIQTILKVCDHPRPTSASFSMRSFDIEINNNPKSTNGKGFTAFYNTTSYGKRRPREFQRNFREFETTRFS